VTRVSVSKDVHCPFSATVEIIEEFHERHKALRIGPFTKMEGRISCEASEIRDVTDRTRIHEALFMRWASAGLIPIPTLYGLITIRPDGLATEVRLEASYVPPLGALGRVFDRILGWRLVRRTLERFVDDMYEFIESRYGLERMIHPRFPRVKITG
jgi:hypothetical protein